MKYAGAFGVDEARFLLVLDMALAVADVQGADLAEDRVLVGFVEDGFEHRRMARLPFFHDEVGVGLVERLDVMFDKAGRALMKR